MSDGKILTKFTTGEELDKRRAGVSQKCSQSPTTSMPPPDGLALQKEPLTYQLCCIEENFLVKNRAP
jgi:hypothetical protein